MVGHWRLRRTAYFKCVGPTWPPKTSKYHGCMNGCISAAIRLPNPTGWPVICTHHSPDQIVGDSLLIASFVESIAHGPCIQRRTDEAAVQLALLLQSAEAQKVPTASVCPVHHPTGQLSWNHGLLVIFFGISPSAGQTEDELTGAYLQGRLSDSAAPQRV